MENTPPVEASWLYTAGIERTLAAAHKELRDAGVSERDADVLCDRIRMRAERAEAVLAP